MATPLISKYIIKRDKEILPEAESPAEHSANKSVHKVLDVLVTGSRKRKRGEFGDHSPDTRLHVMLLKTETPEQPGILVQFWIGI